MVVNHNTKGEQMEINRYTATPIELLGLAYMQVIHSELVDLRVEYKNQPPWTATFLYSINMKMSAIQLLTNATRYLLNPTLYEETYKGR